MYTFDSTANLSWQPYFITYFSITKKKHDRNVSVRTQLVGPINNIQTIKCQKNRPILCPYTINI